jgi:hypothetical protein
VALPTSKWWMRHHSGPISCRSCSAAAAWAVGRSRGRRRVRGASAVGRFLHRHLGVHRLQGVRGGVQGMERGARRRVQPPQDVVRQHGHARRETWWHVAFIEQPSSGQAETVASAIKQTARGGGELGTTSSKWASRSSSARVMAPAPKPARTSAGRDAAGFGARSDLQTTAAR